MDLVAGLIIKNEKILLVHNTKHDKLRIEPPGGKRERNESLEKAVVRECYEELNINVQLNSFFGKYNTNSPEGKFEVHMYFCDIDNGAPAIKEPETISSFDWYSYGQLEKLKEEEKLVPNMCEALPYLKKYLHN